MIHIYTDGSCRGNPGPGGWAYIIYTETLVGNMSGDLVLAEDSGASNDTTNNQMELMAVISALKSLRSLKMDEEKITVYTDSQYVQKGIEEWIINWKKNSWKTSNKKPVKNSSLWQKLDALCIEFQQKNQKITWNWVKGHYGNKYNEHCDKLAKKAIASLS